MPFRALELSRRVLTAIDEAGYTEPTPIQLAAIPEVLAGRDVKGLYKKARNGEIKNFTGLDAPFEEPKTPALEVRTDKNSLETSLQIIVESIYKRIKISQ